MTVHFTDQTSVPIGTYPFSFPDSKNDQLALPPNVDRKFRPPMRTKSSLPSGRLSLSGLRHENARRANWLEFRKKDDAPTLHSECLDRE